VRSGSAGTRTGVEVQRANGRTTEVLHTIHVPQETVFGIASDGSTVYVAGGGDGGVSATTVSGIDVATNAVTFTYTLPGVACSCRVVAGAGGVWLGANGSDLVVRLDPATGHVVRTIALPRAALTIAVVGDRVVVGFDDASLAVVDPASNTLGPVQPVRHPSSEPATGRVAAIVPLQFPRGNAIVARDDGQAYVFVQYEGFSGYVPANFAPTAGADTTQSFWLAGGDRIAGYSSSTGRFTSRTFVYDRGRQRFNVGSDELLFEPAQQGFTQMVAVGDVLWIFDVGAPGAPAPVVLVVRVPAI
jgi:hypothetical protein